MSLGQPRLLRLYLDNGTLYFKAGVTDLSKVSISASDSTYSSGSGGFRARYQDDFEFLELRTSQRITVTGLPTGYKARAVSGVHSAQATETSGSAVIDAGSLVFPLDKIEVLDSSDDPVAELTGFDLADMGGGDVFEYDGTVGHRTTYTWDGTGTFLESIATPIGTTDFAWNTDGTLDSVTDAENHTWAYDYNGYGDLTSATDPLSEVATYGRDAAGRVTSVEDANSSLTEFTYDDKGNLLTLKDPLAEGDTQNRHQIDMSYDDNDNIASIQDARANTTGFTYDDMNHLTLVEDALSGEAGFTYDENYNLESSTDPNAHTTTYTYDDLDRLETVTDPLSKVTEYGYDPVGNLTSITHPSDDVTSFTYADTNLLECISHSGSGATYTYSYNPISAPTEVERNDGKTWTYTYDEGNRLATEADENNSSLGTLTLERTYDDVSNVTDLEIGALVSLALTYDARNLLATFTDPGGPSTFAHDDGGRLTEIATPDGSARSFTYDAAGRVTEVENLTDSGTQVLAYTYDANGNVLSENSTTFTYDALNRLSTWYDPVADVTTEYTYDAGGNLTTVEEDSVPVESYTYNAGDQITNTGYTYDDNGNLTADGTHTYFYDEDNQLVEVLDGQNQIASMTYDMIGRRISLTTSEGTTYFHYLDSLLVAESDTEGNITATYAYSPEGGLLSMTRGAETYYFQTNVHGDVVSITDETGAIVNTYRYNPWGSVLSSSETVDNPFRYAGYYYDEATELYYLWHRYYDPETARFLTIDPAAILTYDRYGYCGDNPLNLADPAGLWDWNWKWFPWSDQNPWYQRAYEGGTCWVDGLNPVYVACVGWDNWWQYAQKGCTSESIESGMIGILASLSIVMPFVPAGEAALVGRTATAGRLGWISGEQGFAGLGAGRNIAEILAQNRNMTVADFVGKYLRGSVKEVLPREFLDMTVQEALDSGNTTIIKLLKRSKYWK
jgi:RHS repeat-associated protein